MEMLKDLVQEIKDTQFEYNHTNLKPYITDTYQQSFYSTFKFINIVEEVEEVE